MRNYVGGFLKGPHIELFNKLIRLDARKKSSIMRLAFAAYLQQLMMSRLPPWWRGDVSREIGQVAAASAAVRGAVTLTHVVDILKLLAPGTLELDRETVYKELERLERHGVIILRNFEGLIQRGPMSHRIVDIVEPWHVLLGAGVDRILEAPAVLLNMLYSAKAGDLKKPERLRMARLTLLFGVPVPVVARFTTEDEIAEIVSSAVGELA